LNLVFDQIDPSRVQEEESDLTENLKNLQYISKLFIDSIVGSLSSCPREIREICRCLREVVVQRFPEFSIFSIGSFLFLRLFNPMIVAPPPSLLSGIAELTPRIRRGLLLVSKLLQNLANSSCVFKESYMKAVEPFIVQHIPRVKEFFEDISSPLDNELESSDSLEQEDKRNIYSWLKELLNIIYESRERIRTEMQNLSPTTLERFENAIRFLADSELFKSSSARRARYRSEKRLQTYSPLSSPPHSPPSFPKFSVFSDVNLL